MNWVLLSICSALLQAVNDVLAKKKLRRISIYAIAWAPYPISFALLLPFLLQQGAPPVGPTFTPTLLLVSVLDVAGVLLYVTAMRDSDLSLVLPIQMCTPIFLLLTTPLMLGEYPSALGFCGVLLIVAGTYVVNINQARRGLLAPFRAIIAERGPRLMFIGAVVWSITWNLHKSAVVASSPLFYVVAHQCTVAFLLGAILFFKQRGVFREVVNNPGCFLFFGVVVSLIFVFQMIAVQTGLPVYVAGIKRMSVLIGVVVGATLFKELGLRQRLAGASIMVAGVFITAL